MRGFFEKTHEVASGWSVSEKPDMLPLSKELAMKHLRLDCNQDTELVATYLDAAVGNFQDTTRRFLLPHTIRATFKRLTANNLLPVGNAQEILAVEKREDITAPYEELDAAEFSLSRETEPGILQSSRHWHAIPVFDKGFDIDENKYRVTYKAYEAETASDIPRKYIVPVLALTAWYYEQATPAVIGSTANALPYHLQAMLSLHKLPSL